MPIMTNTAYRAAALSARTAQTRESQATEIGGTSTRAILEKRNGRVMEKRSMIGEVMIEDRMPARRRAAPYVRN